MSQPVRSEDLHHPAALSKNLSPPVFPGVSEGQRESPRFSPLPLFASCVIPAGGPYHAGASNALLPVWRNGRRDRLKICFPQGSGGSSPSTGTTFKNREASRFFYFPESDGTRFRPPSCNPAVEDGSLAPPLTDARNVVGPE